MPESMRAIDTKDGKGPASALYFADVPKPVPTPTQCLIRVRAFGLNRADVHQRDGTYPMQPWFPKIMGLEFSGEIVEVGDGKVDGDEHEWKVGDGCFGLAYGGAYAEYIAVAKRMLVKKPEAIGWDKCAGLCEVWFTALQALYVVGGYEPARTKSILWHAGASSVSIAGIQLSLAANEGSPHHPKDSHSTSTPPSVFATARKDDKCSFITSELKATAAINSTANDGKWAQAVKDANGGKGVDLVVDFMGASSFAQNLEVLNVDGRVVCLGFLGGMQLPAETSIALLLGKRARIEGSLLRSRDEEYQGRLRDLFEEYALPGLLSGKFEIHVEKVLDWSKIAEAHELLETNQTKGKVICTIDW